MFDATPQFNGNDATPDYMKNKPDQEQFISSLYYVEWKSLEECEKYVKDYLAEERSKVIDIIKVPEDEIVNVMEKAIRNGILDKLNQSK